MKKVATLAVAVVTLVLCGTSWAARRGVTEISESTIRTVYIKKPLAGAKGYVVADWERGEVRVEVKNFPHQTPAMKRSSSKSMCRRTWGKWS